MFSRSLLKLQYGMNCYIKCIYVGECFFFNWNSVLISDLSNEAKVTPEQPQQDYRDIQALYFWGMSTEHSVNQFSKLVSFSLHTSNVSSSHPFTMYLTHLGVVAEMLQMPWGLEPWHAVVCTVLEYRQYASKTEGLCLKTQILPDVYELLDCTRIWLPYFHISPFFYLHTELKLFLIHTPYSQLVLNLICVRFLKMFDILQWQDF